jgi:3'-5' exoribonuclease
MSNLRQILSLDPGAVLSETVTAQMIELSVLKTKGSKEYLVLALHDGSGEAKIKVWSDDPSFDLLREKGLRAFWRAGGDWSMSEYGCELKKGSWVEATDAEKDALLAGGTQGASEIEEAWVYIQERIAAVSHAGLRAVGEKVISTYGDRFRRAGAARKNHHARRGGLILHTAQMLRTGQALVPLYPQANPDILTLGTFFHDLGKIFEHDYQEGFAQQTTFTAEMLGHIAIGMQTFLAFWNEIQAAHPEYFPAEQEMIKTHVVHCILSHHGQAEWGSPIDPKTPEAFILHVVDLLDAKMEMLNNAYLGANQIVPGIVEAAYPLRGSVGLPFNQVIKAKAQS